MEYTFTEIEKKWQKKWTEAKVYKSVENATKQKYYILDMFPYPSGAGLHVGHPLGYIASDILSRFKRLKGFNVLHPMGFDAFGLPAEQYAIQTGQHPAITTEQNIKRYKEQFQAMGFDYDWDRELRTSDPSYYKWTQWTFIQLFKHYFCIEKQKAVPVNELVQKFAAEGNVNIDAASSQKEIFSASQWNAFSEKQQLEILMNYRLAFLADTTVNWCPALGTVLANDEVSEGLSVRGGHPVEKKTMKQWLLRITAYADRLLEGLDRIDWSESIKDIQRNWIGKSRGAMITFQIEGHDEIKMEVFTTRPDTLFGVSFMTYAPEHEAVLKITTPQQMDEVKKYIQYAVNRSERERMTEVKKVTGVFTGAYAINPLSGEKLQIWVADYVLAGYGTGSVMAVPGHDARDHAFAKHFGLPIKEVITGGNIEEAAWEPKEGKMVNSDFINGLHPLEAIDAVNLELKKRDLGYGKTTYRLRDAIFSRQRYWGEPFPVFYKDGVPFMMEENKLPLVLPEVDAYLPTETGEPPLARAKNWKTDEGFQIEVNTMPGFAGSSAYYFRYMDPQNNNEYFSKESVDYWKSVDFYVGGAEHATGHLLYARFWNKFLFDLGLTPEDEPFRKLVNQGMILGRSNIIYRNKENPNHFISAGLIENFEVMPIHVDVNIVNNDILDTEALKKWRPEFANASFETENGKFLCGVEVEKMSKSFYNVVNPDVLISKYGADTLRLYEMFLGPIEQSKPWDTNGIEGVYRFLRKFWRLFFDNQGSLNLSDEEPTAAELKALHKTIRKIEEDIERFSLNTAVSAFMICINELTELKCSKRKILEPLLVLVSPFAPHFAEELWHVCGNDSFVVQQNFPIFHEKYVTESTFECPVSFNGKMRFILSVPMDATQEQVTKMVLEAPEAQKWLEGNPPKKIIVVPRKIVNVVV
jgi:leucyl-tRNA synthetase